MGSTPGSRPYRVDSASLRSARTAGSTGMARIAAGNKGPGVRCRGLGQVTGDAPVLETREIQRPFLRGQLDIGRRERCHSYGPYRWNGPGSGRD